MYNVPLVDGQEADQGEGPIQNQEAGGGLKVQGEEDLIPEREAGGPGAHPKPGSCFSKSVLIASSDLLYFGA